jgi:protein AaeX
VSGEINTFGVFMPIALVTGVSAFVATFIMRRVLQASNAYDLIWHAGLFDVAMFVVLWWLIALAAGSPPT